jgi:hypothetical protein
MNIVFILYIYIFFLYFFSCLPLLFSFTVVRYRLISGRDMTGGINIENVGYIYEVIPRNVFNTINYPQDGVPSPAMPGLLSFPPLLSLFFSSFNILTTKLGGLFAMDRQWFFDSGTYDTEMGYWGTENVEMSIRLWSCGGSIF